MYIVLKELRTFYIRVKDMKYPLHCVIFSKKIMGNFDFNICDIFDNLIIY